MIYLLVLFLVSCTSSSVETQEELEARCTPVLQDIVRIQAHRDIIRKDFELTLLDYSAGNVSEESWQNEKNVWLDRENQLAGEVNRLYSYSYRTKCLE